MTIEDELVGDVLDGVGTGRIELGPGGLGAVGGQRPCAGHRGAVPSARDAAAVGRRAVAGLRDAPRRDARRPRRRAAGRGRSPRPRDRGADARAAGHRGAAVRPPRHPLGDEDRSRGVRPGTVRGLERSATCSGSSAYSPSTGSSARTKAAAGRSSTMSSPLPCSVGRRATSPNVRFGLRRRRRGRRHRRLGFLAFGALVGLAAAAALAAFAFSQRSEARDQARVATGGQLVASALSEVETRPRARRRARARGRAGRFDAAR